MSGKALQDEVIRCTVQQPANIGPLAQIATWCQHNNQYCRTQSSAATSAAEHGCRPLAAPLFTELLK